MPRQTKNQLQEELKKYSLAEIEAEEEALLAELQLYLEAEEYEQSESSLYSFFRSAWSYYDPQPFIDNWHLGCLCEHGQAAVNREIRKLLITIPPRCSKSSIFSIALPAWVWGPANLPHEKFITASYSEDLTTQFSVRTRQLMNHPWYRSRWMGTDKRFALIGDTKTRIDNDKHGYRIATSPGGQGQGIGYSICIIDDPLNGRYSTSKAKKEENALWYKGTLKNRANDKKTDVMIVIAQRLAEDDLPGLILEEEKDLWFHLNLPMEYEKKYTFISPIGYNDPRTVENEVLDPNRFDEDALEEQKRNPFQYATLYQQRPAPPEGGIIKTDWLKEYSQKITTANDYHYMVISADLSMTDSESSDYTVITVWGRLNKDFYLVDMIREKMAIERQLEAIKQLAIRYPNARTKLIEHKANGPAVVRMLQKEFPGVIAIEPKDFGGNKEARLSACVPEFASRSVFFPLASECSWVKDVIQELITFPRSKNDDIVDSISQAINWMSLNQRTVELPLAAAPDPEETQRKNITHLFPANETQETYANYSSMPGLSNTRKMARELWN